MEDDLNLFERGKQLNVFKNENDQQQKIMQPKTIQIEDNGCGTATANLVV